MQSRIKGDNVKRSLDVIGAELRKLRNIFDSGELLAEAQDACEYGEWLEWLETFFDASQDTAERHMAAYRLACRFRTVRNLGLPPTIVYQLGEDFDAPTLPAIIEALGKASKSAKKSLSVADCRRVITVALAREAWGDDLPDATLVALEGINRGDKWAAGAIEELKTARPDTDEAAARVVLAQYRKHLEEAVFGGALPDWLNADMFDYLSGVEPMHCKQVLARLQAVAQPLDDWQEVVEIVRDVRRGFHLGAGDEDQDDAEDQNDDEAPTPPPMDEQDDADDDATDEAQAPLPPDSMPELIDALRVIVHHARRPLPTSIAGIEGADLAEAARYLDKLHEIATAGNAVKRIADRAQARAGRTA
jgi:Protein of unknown function (DUF3102)